MKNLVEFLRRYIHVFVFVALESIALYAVVSSTSYKQWRWNAWGKELCGPLLKRQAKIRSYMHLNRDNQILQEANRSLLHRIYNVDVGEKTVKDYYLGSLHHPVFAYKIAHVIENTTNLPDNYLILDKGSNDSLRPGLGVLSEHGVVGIVKEVSPHFSVVMSLLHSKFNLSVILKGGVVTGVLYWDGHHHRQAVVRNVSSLDDVSVGDTLWTHHSLIFPPQYPIATVSEVSKEVEDGFYTLKVRLLTPFDRLSAVWVVENNFYDELKSLKDSIAP
ncbi:MAG: rod shape-determining protein MreC [Bacteroidales bacterium]|nr:rod shape-determining protein MreC [Bacteroidales bacterium]